MDFRLTWLFWFLIFNDLRQRLSESVAVLLEEISNPKPQTCCSSLPTGIALVLIFDLIVDVLYEFIVSPDLSNRE